MSKSNGLLMAILHRQKQIYANVVLKEYGINASEFPFLLYLYEHNGSTQEEMSSYLFIDKSATTRAIKSLVDKEYVIKEKDPEDKRCNRIWLTDQSKSIEKSIREKVHQWNTFLEKDLTNEQIQTLHEILLHMTEKVEKTQLRKKLENHNGKQ